MTAQLLYTFAVSVIVDIGLFKWCRPWWSWSYFSWIHNYLCNQHLSPLMLWVRISIRARCTTLCDKVCQWIATGRWFSPGPSTNKTDHYDIGEILLNVALNTIKSTNKANDVYARLFLLRQCSHAPSRDEVITANAAWFKFMIQSELTLITHHIQAG